MRSWDSPPRGRVVPAENTSRRKACRPMFRTSRLCIWVRPTQTSSPEKNDDVESRIIRRGTGERTAVAEVVVTRRHPVGRRLESLRQRARALSYVSARAIVVRVRTRLVVITVLRSQSLRFGDLRLPLGTWRASASACGPSAAACCLRAIAVLSCRTYKSSLAYPDDA